MSEDYNELKAAGNSHFKRQEFEEALALFEQALAVAKENNAGNRDVAILYSNISGAQLSLGRAQDAEAAARACVEHDSGFLKGHARLGAALQSQNRRLDALEAYKKIKAADPSNTAYDSIIKDLETPTQMPQDMNLDALKAQLKQMNPEMYSQLEEMMKKGAAGANPMGGAPNNPSPSASPECAKPPPSKSSESAESEATPKAAACSEFDLKVRDGKAAYEAKNFAKAIELFSEAKEINSSDYAVDSNIAAAYIELNDFEKAREVCLNALENEMSLTLKGKLLLRISTTYMKEHNNEEALAYALKARLEDKNRAVMTRIRELNELIAKDKVRKAFNPEKSEAKKQEGNEAYKKGDFIKAQTLYGEAIEMNRENSVLYSNRAMAYIKLLTWTSAEKDYKKALELDSKNVKAYYCKAKTMLAMDRMLACFDAIEVGKMLDPKNGLLNKVEAEARERVHQISMYDTEQQIKDRIEKDPDAVLLMQDPDVGRIMTMAGQDPAFMRQVQSDPILFAKAKKLMNIGILRMR